MKKKINMMKQRGRKKKVEKRNITKSTEIGRKSRTHKARENGDRER